MTSAMLEQPAASPSPARRAAYVQKFSTASTRPFSEFFGDEGRGAENRLRDLGDVFAEHLARIRAQQHPALVDAAAGDPDLLAFESAKDLTGLSARHHRNCQAPRNTARISDRSLGTLAERPRPVADDHVSFASQAARRDRRWPPRPPDT